MPGHVHGRFAGAATSLLLVYVVAACGTTTPTSTAYAPTASTLAGATPLASPTPNISIVPVPQSRAVGQTAYSATLDAATASKLQSTLNGIRGADKIPGVSAAVMFPDGSIWQGVSGQAVMSPSTSMTADTILSAGSITKTFIAALICRLAEEGKLSLDDHLDKFVPDFTNASKITIRQLLDHTSGIKDLFKVSAITSTFIKDPTRTWTADQVLAKIGPQLYQPGSYYYYSNTEYVLLGKVVEKASGQSVSALLRSDFLAPLGMTHTFLQTEEKVTGPQAHGYMTKGSSVSNFAGTMLPTTAEATAAGASGAIVSTASDLAVWANALYGGYVLDQADLAWMVDISPSLAIKSKTRPYGLGYGLGLETATVAGQTGWGHRGHLDGFWAAMEYLPASHITIVILTNADWIDPVAAASTLGTVALS